eukprot:56916-Rhodomonas_salina.5
MDLISGYRCGTSRPLRPLLEQGRVALCRHLEERGGKRRKEEERGGKRRKEEERVRRGGRERRTR